MCWGQSPLKKSKSQGDHLALNTLLRLNKLKYSFPKAYMLLFRNPAIINVRLLAHNQPRQSKFCFRINRCMLQ
jgi:hypothetical protein